MGPEQAPGGPRQEPTTQRSRADQVAEHHGELAALRNIRCWADLCGRHHWGGRQASKGPQAPNSLQHPSAEQGAERNRGTIGASLPRITDLQVPTARKYRLSLTRPR